MTPPRFTRNKYRARKTEYKGRVFDSKGEAFWASVLDLDPLSHVVEFQPRFSLGVAENVYRGDFLVAWSGEGLKDTTFRAITAATALMICVDDYKGMETAKFKRDKKLWLSHGPCALRIIKNKKLVEVLIPDKFNKG